VLEVFEMLNTSELQVVLRNSRDTVSPIEPLYCWLKNWGPIWMMVFDVLTSQFSELAISCISWRVKENRHHYSGNIR
jgi:hypothetical protein